MLEVIVTSVAEYEQAVAAGADRVELVSAMELDGLSPSHETLVKICAQASIPVRVMVRVMNHRFYHTQAEIEQLCAWIVAHRELAIDGFVIGGICPDGSVDTRLLDAVSQVCGSIPLTFHRAFDELTPQQQLQALQVLKRYPVDTILTSGGRNQPIGENLAHLAALAKAAKPIQILLGGGVNQNVVQKLAAYPQLSAIHVGSAVREANDFLQPIKPEVIQLFQQHLRQNQQQ